MEIEFTGELFYWRGPAPFYFIAVPQEESDKIKPIAKFITYGWGVIPAYIKIGDTALKTALFPKDGKYLVPVKSDLRKAELLEEGDQVTVQLEIKI